MCCGVDFNSFLCEEWHSQRGLGICERSNKEIGRFFRGPILRGDIDPAVDLFFNQYAGGMKRLADAHGRADWEVWEIDMTSNPGRDGVDRGTSVNQCPGPSLGDLDRNANRGDRLVWREFLIRFDYDG